MPLRSIAFFLLCTIFIGIEGCHYANQHPTANSGNTVTKPEVVTLIGLLIGTGTRNFRNILPGASMEYIKKTEKKTPDEADSNYLAYTLPMDTLHPDSVNENIDSLNYFTIGYNFDRQKLTDADEDIFLSSDSAAAILYNRFVSWFTSQYGKSEQAGDNLIWNFMSKGNNIKISLSDQSSEYDYGKLSLVFYCEDY